MKENQGFWISLPLAVWYLSVATFIGVVHHSYAAAVSLGAVGIALCLLTGMLLALSKEEGLRLLPTIPLPQISFSTQLSLFTTIMVVHFIEHVTQLGQIHMLHWDRSDALGFVGLAYPWLVQSEVLHYCFAAFMLGGLIYFRRYFLSDIISIRNGLLQLRTYTSVKGVLSSTDNPYAESAFVRANQAYRLWSFAMWFQVFHFFEHNVLMLQVISGHNLLGASVPTSLGQALIPQMRAELHFVYTLIATIPMVTASTLRMSTGLASRVVVRLRAML